MDTKSLLQRFPRPGRLEWIGLAARPRGPIRSVESAVVAEGTGLEGDHHARSGRGKRQVTLIQAEHVGVLESLLGRAIEPQDLRRNLLVSGINLAALKDQRFRIGPVVLQGTEPCHPCSRMEENLGPGGLNAMRGHGGLVATVVEGGTIRVGDPVFVPCVDVAGAD